jgi:hypothetical protein
MIFCVDTARLPGQAMYHIRKRHKSGWSFYEVFFGTYFEVTLTFLNVISPLLVLILLILLHWFAPNF